MEATRDSWTLIEDKNLEKETDHDKIIAAVINSTKNNDSEDETLEKRLKKGNILTRK